MMPVLRWSCRREEKQISTKGRLVVDRPNERLTPHQDSQIDEWANRQTDSINILNGSLVTRSLVRDPLLYV